MYQLTKDDSFSLVEESADRHVRLCAVTPGGEKYSIKIKGVIDELLDTLAERKAAGRNLSSTSDIVWLFEGIIDDVIRKIQGRAKEYDNEHPGSNLVSFLLPDGNITPLIALAKEEKPKKLPDLSMKITSLGNTHTLFPLAAELNTALVNCEAKMKLQSEAETTYNNANSVAILAKLAVVEKYNANYFDAGNDTNKKYAEKLFPRMPRKPKDEDDESNANSVTPPENK